MGAYCNFCQTRCFVLRVIPDGPDRGRSFHLATCQEGMVHDLAKTGHTHISAINPASLADALRASLAAARGDQPAAQPKTAAKRAATAQQEACEHCGEPIRKHYGASPLNWRWVHSATIQMSCGSFYSTTARPVPAIPARTPRPECRWHGDVDEDHFPCRRPGESAMDFTSRALGEWRDV